MSLLTLCILYKTCNLYKKISDASQPENKVTPYTKKFIFVHLCLF